MRHAVHVANHYFRVDCNKCLMLKVRTHKPYSTKRQNGEFLVTNSAILTKALQSLIAELEAEDVKKKQRERSGTQTNIQAADWERIKESLRGPKH